MNGSLLFEQRGPIGVLTMNRPERLNAVDYDMLRALKSFFEDRHRDYATASSSSPAPAVRSAPGWT